MPRLAYRFFLAACAMASCAGLLSLSAQASTHLGIYLKTYYTDFQVVTDCSTHHRLTAADVAKAKDALAKIESYYLRRDPSINKEKLMKQALANNKVAYKMMAETQKIDPGVFCRSSLNDLMSKLREIDGDATAKKSGS